MGCCVNLKLSDILEIAAMTLPEVSGVRYNRGRSGSNSAVECDLAKVEVAGSNPVSRSNF